ncbi:hypothetical protein PG5_60970 [Pseudomonas sp. G5(2012)]|nr:hypothetical protein PG5_60970 [Pseudomonas sp. G5(2012)]
MLNASTVAMTCTVKTVAKTKQTQEKLIYADQICSESNWTPLILIRFFHEQLNL